VDVQDVDSFSFGFELWTPARVAQPRLILGHEAKLRGKLFSLRSEVYSPGPFDNLVDVQAVVEARLRQAVSEILNATPDI
jgi:hypothetical protein